MIDPIVKTLLLSAVNLVSAPGHYRNMFVAEVARLSLLGCSDSSELERLGRVGGELVQEARVYVSSLRSRGLSEM